jgi:alkylresorcinol/alkylpyrone synthase
MTDIAARPKPRAHAAHLGSARLRSVATAVPSHILSQADVLKAAATVFAPKFADFSRLMPVYENAQIETRHSCVPLSWFLSPRDLKERNDRYIENAVSLLADAATRAIAAAGLSKSDIDGIVSVSTSGIATPSLDALVMERLGLRPDLQRLPIFGLGCAGGVIGLARTAQLSRAEPGRNFLFLVVELCSLNFLHNDLSKSNVVAAALFADGAAAAVISTARDGQDDDIGTGMVIRASGEHTWPNSLDIMGWDVGSDGFKVVFSRDIPSLARTELRPIVDRFLGLNGLTRADIDSFICHPGGAKVLDALEVALDVEPGRLAISRDILRRYGNMSAATIMFVLEETLRTQTPELAMLTTFGPGFTSALLLLERVS